MPSEADDLAELVEKIGSDLPNAGARKQSPTARKTPAPWPDSVASYGEPPKPGEFIQYARFGHGYVGSASTIKSIPAGIYKIEFIDGVPIYALMKVVTDDILRLPDSRSDEVIRDIETFWSVESKARFHDLRFAYKRGFLLWGPQGSGKTSTVNVVMQQIVQRGGIVLVAGQINPQIVSMMLSRFRQIEPNRPAVVILEDIDAIIITHGEQEVLSLLDGESSIDNVVYIATTNYPERLDPRIANRPSRFDKVVKIDFPNEDARRIYLSSRNLNISDVEMQKWVRTTAGFSIAHLKELVVSTQVYRCSFEETIIRLRSMARMPNSSTTDRPAGFGVDLV